MTLLREIWEWVNAIVSFGSNLITIILGLIAFWALVFHNKKFALLFQVLLTNFVNERVKRIKETLGKLESLDYDTKNDRPEIVALLGQVSGQIKPFTNDDSDLKLIHEELMGLLKRKTRLSEATKRRVVYEMHGALDGVSYTKSRAIAELEK